MSGEGSLSPSDGLGHPIAFKFAPGSSVGTIEGYASTFGGQPDTYGDIVQKGAFAATLKEHRDTGTAPAMLWGHDMGSPIGRWIDLREDATGLHVTGKLTMDVARAQEAYALAKDGALALSIGYGTRKASRLDGNRILENVKLYEISLVAIAANPSARITSVKAPVDVSTIDNPRAFESFLRDAGFSRAFAKAVTASGFKTAAGLRDADAANLADIASSMRAGATKIRNITKGNQ